MFGKATIVEVMPFAVAAVASAAAIHLSLFDHFCMWVRSAEAHEADEYVGTVFAFIIAAALWAWRQAAVVSAKLRETEALATLEGRLAREDALTGLANRRAFIEIVEDSPQDAALLLLDLNEFKKINDELGHAVGDGVLVEVAHRLRELEASGHISAPARLGGDEFACLSLGDSEGVLAVVRARLCAPVQLDTGKLRISASIGVSRRSMNCSFDELVRRADALMYSAKRASKANGRTIAGVARHLHHSPHGSVVI